MTSLFQLVVANNVEFFLSVFKKEKDAHWRDRIDKRHVMLALFSGKALKLFYHVRIHPRKIVR